MIELENKITSVWDGMVKHRRWLHENPELSGQEKNTAAYIAKCLREMGLEPTENVGGYGVTAVIEGKAPGKCLGLRADFDALEIQEQTGLAYASRNPGVSHACGHDTHTAMLLGTAQILNEMRDQFCGSVKLLFQPSEENAADSGAKKMIADGALENPHVDAVVGQHVKPNYPVGTIALAKGTMTASSDRFFIRIGGKTSHGSEPHSGVDAVTIGAQVISALQTIVARTVDPQDSVVITIGKVSGGSRYNIIADSFEMEGTCRTHNVNVQKQLPDRMESIIKGVAEGMGGTYEFTYVKGFIPLVNNANQVELVCRTAQKVLGDGKVTIMEKASMVGEDFAFFANEVPGAFYYVGCRKEGEDFYPLHNSRFAPDEEAMKTGIKLMVSAALEYLK